LGRKIEFSPVLLIFGSRTMVALSVQEPTSECFPLFPTEVAEVTFSNSDSAPIPKFF